MADCSKRRTGQVGCRGCVAGEPAGSECLAGRGAAVLRVAGERQWVNSWPAGPFKGHGKGRESVARGGLAVVRWLRGCSGWPGVQ